MAHLLGNLKYKATDSNGDPLVGGLLYSYQAGTTTLLATFADQSEATPNSNPVILDANGEASVWLGTNAYKFTLCDANDVEIYTVDNVSHISDSSIGSAKLANGSVITTKIADGNVTTAKIADNAVTTDKIQNSAVTTPKIADNAVTAAKIPDGSIVTTKLADESVTTGKVALGAITYERIGNGAVANVKIANNTITTEKISICGAASTGIPNSSTMSTTLSNLGSSMIFNCSGGLTVAQVLSFAVNAVPDGYFKLGFVDTVGGQTVTVKATLVMALVPTLNPALGTHNCEHTFGFETTTVGGTSYHGHFYPPGSFSFNFGYLPVDVFIGQLQWKISVSAPSGGVTAILTANDLMFTINEVFAKAIPT